MKLRNILIAAATMGVMFASADRTNILGYTAGDYHDMNTFAHKATNVAYTSGESFNLAWSDGGTTWGFNGGAADELINMLWSNGNYGVTFGMNMVGEATVANTSVVNGTGDGCTNDGTSALGDFSDCTNESVAAAETLFNMGFGMNLAGWDVGFKMGTADNAGMSLNARGALGFWAFDTMTVNYWADDNYSDMSVNLYGLQEWGAATGMFSMGLRMADNDMWDHDDNPDTDDVAVWADSATLLTTGFSVESTLTDWCELRIGYNKSFNLAPGIDEHASIDSFGAGVGFNLGSVTLDMTLSDGTLDGMMNNPLNYISGYNSDDLSASWTLSYTW